MLVMRKREGEGRRFAWLFCNDLQLHEVFASVRAVVVIPVLTYMYFAPVAPSLSHLLAPAQTHAHPRTYLDISFLSALHFTFSHVKKYFWDCSKLHFNVHKETAYKV